MSLKGEADPSGECNLFAGCYLTTTPIFSSPAIPLHLFLQWNPSITDTIGEQHLHRYSKVFPTQGLLHDIFPVGVVLRNPAVEYSVAAFSELSFAAHWRGRLTRG